MNYLLLLLMVSPVHAGPYVEIGIANANGGTCVKSYEDKASVWNCSKSPLGNLAIGYAYKGFSAELEHLSSIQERDRGLNLFTIKYRWEFIK